MNKQIFYRETKVWMLTTNIIWSCTTRTSRITTRYERVFSGVYSRDRLLVSYTLLERRSHRRKGSCYPRDAIYGKKFQQFKSTISLLMNYFSCQIILYLYSRNSQGHDFEIKSVFRENRSPVYAMLLHVCISRKMLFATFKIYFQ